LFKDADFEIFGGFEVKRKKGNFGGRIIRRI